MIPVSNLYRDKIFLSSVTCPDRLCGLPSFLLNGYWVSFWWGGGVEWPERKAGHFPTSVDVKNEYSYTSSSGICLRVVDRECFVLPHKKH